MSNKYLNLQGTDKIKDTYDEINDAFGLVEDDNDTQDTRMDSHVGGTAENHNASDIVNDSAMTGTKVSDALTGLKTQVDEAVVGGDANSLIGVFTIADTGSANAYAGVFAGQALFTDMKIHLTNISADNTGASTMSYDGGDAKSIVKIVRNVKTELSPRDIRQGEIAILEYDGTDFILLNGEREAEYSTEVSTYEKVIHLDDTVVKGQVSVAQRGQTVSNSVKNGNFVNANNWEILIGSVSNNVLTVGTSASNSPRAAGLTDITPSEGKKIFARVEFEPLVEMSTFRLRSDDEASNTGKQDFEILSNPEIGKAYSVYGIVELSGSYTTGNLRIVPRGYLPEAISDDCFKIREVLTVDLTTHNLEDKTTEELNAMFPHYIDGTKSTVSTRLKSVGKNHHKQEALYNNHPSTINYTYNDATNTHSLSTYTTWGGRGVFSHPIKVKPNTNYGYSRRRINGQTSFLTTFIVNNIFPNNTHVPNAVKVVDNNHSGVNSFTFNTGNNEIIYIFNGRINSNPNFVWDNVMIEEVEDQQLGIYEPFKNGGEAYLPPIGGSVPNGTKDEVSASVSGGWEKVQRVSEEYTLVSDDISQIITSGTHVDRVTIPVSTFVNWHNLSSNGSTGSVYIYDTRFAKEVNVSSSVFDVEGQTTCHAYGTEALLFIVPKGYYADLAAAKADLAGTTLTYQLAEPMITPLQGIGQLIAYPNGTVYVTPTTKQETTHKEGMLLEFPVSWLESVTLLNINGTETQIDLDDATIHRKGDDATAEAGTNTTNVTVTGHGLSVGDRIRNTDRDNEIREILTVVDANNVTVNEITGQTDGDTIEIYSDSEEDKTQNAIVSIEDADEGSLYQVIYDIPNEIRTNPELSYSYPQNVSAVIQGNTQMIKVTNKELTDFMSYQNAVNIAFDLRITAVE